MIKTKYKPTDILAIIHVLDTDGSMIPEYCVEIKNEQVNPTIYANDKIIVNSSNKKTR